MAEDSRCKHLFSVGLAPRGSQKLLDFLGINISLSYLCEQQQHPLGRRAQKSLHEFLHPLAPSVCTDLPWSVLVYSLSHLNFGIFHLYVCFMPLKNGVCVSVNINTRYVHTPFLLFASTWHLIQFMCIVPQFVPILVLPVPMQSMQLKKFINADGIKASKTILTTIWTCMGNTHVGLETTKERFI